MAKFKGKNVGRGATLITLLSNPMVRRVAIRAATQAANKASDFVSSRSEQKKASSPSAGQASPGSRPIRVESQTKVIPPNPGAKASPSSSSSAKPSSFADSAAVESIVSTIASAAKPVAEKMATSSAGRSVLEAINSLSGHALGSSSGPPKKAGAAVASFVNSILAGQAAQKPQPTQQKRGTKFEPVKPPPPVDPPPVQTMQWPPPKSSNGS